MTDQPTRLDLDEIEARASNATPGPWEEHDDYGPHFYAYLRGPYLRGVGTLNFGDGEDAAADREFVKHAREDVDALLAEVRRLRAAMEEIQRLHCDSPMGPCPVCIDADAAAEGGDGLVPYPCPTGRLAGAQDCDPPHVRAARYEAAGDVMAASLVRDGFGDDEIASMQAQPAAEDTLPAWLARRFDPRGADWDGMSDDDRAYWAHQADAVRRAVARGGFKNPAPAAVLAVETGR